MALGLQLQAISGAPAGQAMTLAPPGGVVGRSGACRVVLVDDLASRQHAAFEPADGGWAVVDLGSTNGTQVNGRSIPPHQPVVLHTGDRVQIGGSVFRITLIATATAPPAAARPAGPWNWLGRLLPALGGALLVIGAFLPWLQVTVTPTLLGFSLGEQSAVIGGLQGFGPLTLAIGALLLAVVLLDMLVRPASRWPGIALLLLVVAGLAVMGVGVVTFEASSQQLARQLGQAFGIDLLSVLESDLFQEVLTILGGVIQPQLALREGVFVTAAGLLLALLGGASRVAGGR